MRISDWSSDVCSSDLPRTVEIGDIGTNRVLLAEFQPGLRALYPLPDQDFGQGQFATKLARGVHFGPAHLGHAPSTALRAVPLPVSGRICHRHHAAHPFFSIHAWQLDRKSTRLNSSH